MNLPPKKQAKYLNKVRELLSVFFVTSKEIEKLLGYLCFASWVEPFGRPFLSALTLHVNRENPEHLVCLDNYSILALKI